MNAVSETRRSNQIILKVQTFTKRKMGKPVSDLYSETIKDGLDMDAILHLDGIRQMNPQSLKLFLEQFFSTMSLTAKETIVEILWNSMSIREQHLFDMPSFDNRMTTEQIHANLASTNLVSAPRRVMRQNHQTINVPETTRIGANVVSRLPTHSWWHSRRYGEQVAAIEGNLPSVSNFHQNSPSAFIQRAIMIRKSLMLNKDCCLFF